MLHQFPLPEDVSPTAKDQTILIGQTILNLIETPHSGKGFLNLSQRAILADLCLATLQGKATLIEQISRNLGVKERRATALTSDVKQFLLKTGKHNGDASLQTAITEYPERRTRKGYYLKVVSPTDIKPTQPETSVAEITKKIKTIKEALFSQIQTADKQKVAIPTEDPTRQEVLATIEDVRKEVEQALSMTKHPLREDTRTLLQILLEAAEKGEAIMVPEIARRIKETKKRTMLVLYKLNETLKRSNRMNLALKSQRDPQNGKKFGYYIGQKQETQTQKRPAKSTLSATTKKLTEDQRRTLARLIDRAIKQTRPQARRTVIIFETLKRASTSGKQITPAYCQYVGYQLYQETSPIRNFEDKLLRLQEIPEDQFGFRIERTGSNTWEAVATTNREILDPILAEIIGEDDAATEKNPAELEKRVHEGLRHLRVDDRAALERIFDSLIRVYTEKQGLSLEEISTRAKFQNKQLITRWLQRVQTINEELPTMLGFNVIIDGAEKYGLELTRRYVPVEKHFSQKSAPHPISVEEDMSFDRKEFDKIMGSDRNKQIKRCGRRLKTALEILARHSSRKQAISSLYLEAELRRITGVECKKDRAFIQRSRKSLEKIKDGKITIHPYKLCTWYLTVDEPADKTSSTPLQSNPARQAYAARPARPAHPNRPPRLKPVSDESHVLDDDEFFSTTVEEIPNSRPTKLVPLEVKPDDKYTSHLPETPLMAFQRAIVTLARKHTNPSIEDIRTLEVEVRALETRGQHHLSRVKEDYLAKLRRVIQKALNEGNGSIPEHLVRQLHSI